MVLQQGESLPRQAAKRRTPSEDTSQAMDSIVPEDISKDLDTGVV